MRRASPHCVRRYGYLSSVHARRRRIMFTINTPRSFAAVRPLGLGLGPIFAQGRDEFVAAHEAPARQLLRARWAREDAEIDPARLVLRWGTQGED